MGIDGGQVFQTFELKRQKKNDHNLTFFLIKRFSVFPTRTGKHGMVLKKYIMPYLLQLYSSFGYETDLKKSLIYVG